MLTLRPNTFRDPKMDDENAGRDVVLLSQAEAHEQGIEQDQPWIVIWADGSHQGFETHETALWRQSEWRKLNHVTEDGQEKASVILGDLNLLRRY